MSQLPIQLIIVIITAVFRCASFYHDHQLHFFQLGIVSSPVAFHTHAWEILYPGKKKKSPVSSPHGCVFLFLLVRKKRTSRHLSSSHDTDATTYIHERRCCDGGAVPHSFTFVVVWSCSLGPTFVCRPGADALSNLLFKRISGIIISITLSFIVVSIFTSVNT